MTHKGEYYSVKMQKYYFCNGTPACNGMIKLSKTYTE